MKRLDISLDPPSGKPFICLQSTSYKKIQKMFQKVSIQMVEWGLLNRRHMWIPSNQQTPSHRKGKSLRLAKVGTIWWPDWKLSVESLCQLCTPKDALRILFRNCIHSNILSFNSDPKCAFISCTIFSGVHVGRVEAVKTPWEVCVMKGSLGDNRERKCWHAGQGRFDIPMMCPKSCYLNKWGSYYNDGFEATHRGTI